MRASITRLTSRLKDLEKDADKPATLDLAQGMTRKLDSLDADFRTHHHAVVDVVDDEETLEREQTTLDEHDDVVAELAARIEQLVSLCVSTSDSSPCRIASRRLSHLQKKLLSVSESITSSDRTVDTCLLNQYEEQLGDIKRELADIRNGPLLHIDETDELCTMQATLESEVFDCSLQIKKLLHRSSNVPSSPLDGKGVKLPKLDVPTFDGNILNWKSFWEQFCVSVHDRSTLSDSEKLVYLQHSLKNGSARKVIEGLSRSGEYYTEAIESLKSQYDRPRLIHQTHVRMILDAPPLKEGSGKELRRLYDTVQQHLRALKAMEHEPSGPFITSVLELKLDVNTMFEWQRHSQDDTDVPHYNKLLEFINLRVQASETLPTGRRRAESHSTQSTRNSSQPTNPVASFAANAADSATDCVLCQGEKHPLYACHRFKALPHDQMTSTLKAHKLCMNFLRPGHFVRQCKSVHRCKQCQRSHHTLLHKENEQGSPPQSDTSVRPVTSHAAAGLSSNSLLMTCCVLVDAADGSSIEARAILDSASSASFISERLTRTLCLTRSHQNTRISGVAGLSRNSPLQSVANFRISPTRCPTKKFNVSAVVVPRVTCDLPQQPVPFDSSWKHVEDLQLADPDFGRPGRIDILLEVDIFIETLLQGRRSGPPNTPSAFETEFGWVLAGRLDTPTSRHHVISHHVSLATGDDLLRRFWEIEEGPTTEPSLSAEERSVIQHFKNSHSRDTTGRFTVPLPKRPNAKLIGESRTQAVRRFLSLERSLHSKGQFDAFKDVMEEYFQMGHAELVPAVDLQKSQHEVFYLPMHAVRKEPSSTTKIRAVFDASAKTSTGISLNDTLLVGPTVHSSLIDVLLRFRFHRIALTTDVSRMYRAIELTPSDRDLHRFVWRSDPNSHLGDYRMTRVTFGVSASSFAANMAVKQNALDFALEYPQAAAAVEKSFYVDDGLTGANSVCEAVELQKQLQELFSRGGFLLRKWKSSEPAVVQHLPAELKETNSTQTLPSVDEYTKTLGIEWNAHLDHFRLTVADLPPLENVTKRVLVSDIAKTYDVLEWFAPTIIKAKILLQQLWELKVDWDDHLPPEVHEVWLQWRSELKCLTERPIPRCYFPRGAHIVAIELHGFSDASERAYAGVVYLRMMDANGDVHISLVASKTKVAPIKRLTIPRLELCGAHILAQLLHHVQQAFDLPLSCVYAWTDSTIVLNWLVGNPRRFKTYVGNRVSHILELTSPDRWNHVDGVDNPADCASRGLLPSELLEHKLWWNGPAWLKLPSSDWPKQSPPPDVEPVEEEKAVCAHTTMQQGMTCVSPERYSSFMQLKIVTAWVFRFVRNSRVTKAKRNSQPQLSTQELRDAEAYWLTFSQDECFEKEIQAIKNGQGVSNSSSIFSLHPMVDPDGLLRIGGRLQNSQLSYSARHPVILDGKHKIAKLIIRSEHLRLLHAGPTLLAASLSSRYHIVGSRKAIRSVVRGCIVCRRSSVKPQPQMLGQLPRERVTPGAVFDDVSVDYAGPIYIKYGFVRKPTIVKAYICVFVSFSVKAVHLELVSDLTTEAFLATLRRFIARRGKPSTIWSDHGTNFVGAARELKELTEFLKGQEVQNLISKFCSAQNIQWRFIPERAPHFGGLWEAAVKGVKIHLKHVVSNVKLTFEEYSTVLAQVEACLNSRPLTPLPSEGDIIEVLTPGHFLIGKPLEALPDPPVSYRSISLLRRWHMCQALVRHFWQRWSREYIVTLRR